MNARFPDVARIYYLRLSLVLRQSIFRSTFVRKSCEHGYRDEYQYFKNSVSYALVVAKGEDHSTVSSSEGC